MIEGFWTLLQWQSIQEICASEVMYKKWARTPPCKKGNGVSGCTLDRRVGTLTWAKIVQCAPKNLTYTIKTGWWFGTFFIVPYIGNNHPNWLSYFSEGFKPPTSWSPWSSIGTKSESLFFCFFCLTDVNNWIVVVSLTLRHEHGTRWLNPYSLWIPGPFTKLGKTTIAMLE